MRRLLCLALFAFAACGPRAGSQRPRDDFDPDARSGPDGKRSRAQPLQLNKPHTDEVSYQNQDRTDWYVVELRGKPGVLTTLINWDNDASDVNIDVFDAFGAEIAASPVRSKGEKQKKLFAQIDKPGTYYLRVTAPTKTDASVYTMEAEWEEPPAVAPGEPPAEEKPRHRVRERERPTGETVEARVVSAYREGGALMMYIDKGSAAGIKVGNEGVVLQGSGGEDPVDGGQFKIVKVIDGNKSVGAASMRSLGRNNRVAITLGR
jgi:hypothetical protein